MPVPPKDACRFRVLVVAHDPARGEVTVTVGVVVCADTNVGTPTIAAVGVTDAAIINATSRTRRERSRGGVEMKRRRTTSTDETIPAVMSVPFSSR